MSSRPDHDGSDTKNGSPRTHHLIERQIQKAIVALSLSRLSRRVWLTTALSLLAASSAVAIWQLHWTTKWHEPWTFLSSGWWLNPVEFNADAALPRFNRRLEVIAVQPSDNRVWLAGDAGFVAVADSDGRDWTELKYDYDSATGELRKSASPTRPGREASPKVSRLHVPDLVPSVFAGEAPRQVTASRQEITFSKGGERQTVMITNETSVPAYVNSVSVEMATVFAVQGTCRVIQPGQGCELSVQFKAPSTGMYNSRLVVSLTQPEGQSAKPTTLYITLIGNSGSNPKGTAGNDRSPSDQSRTADKGGFNVGTQNALDPKKRKQNDGIRPPVADRSQGVVGAAKSGTPATPWKPPSRLGNILAMEWTSGVSARMVTEDAVIYSTGDGGDTWQAGQWSIPGDGTPKTLSIGEKDLERRNEAGKARATVASMRIPDPTRTYWDTGKIVAFAKSPASNTVWLIERLGGGTATNLLRSTNGIRFWNASRTGDEGVYWRLPAPWYWFLALPLVLLGAAAAAFAGTEALKMQESVSNVGISDRPLEPGEPDAMNLNALVQGLSLFLRNKSTKPPLVLAVNGDWGTGKSSLMNLLQKDLQLRGARAVWFNAWHHQKEQQLLAALLQTVRKDAVPAWWTPHGLWLRAKLLVKRGRKVWWAFAILFAAAAFLISTALDIHTARTGLLWNYTNLWLDAYKNYVKEGALPSWLKHAPLYTTILGVLYALNSVRKSATAFGANPASLLASFSGSGRIKDLEAQTSFRQQFSSEFRQVVEVLGSHRLLIVIDDLDRCRPEKVREVLETVNFLVSSADCFVILGLARSIVEHCVGLSFATIVDTMPPSMLGQSSDTLLSAEEKRGIFAHRYLQKLVQLEVRLPQLTEEQARVLLGAEPAALMADEQRRKIAEAKHRRDKFEGQLRVGFQWIARWMLPAMACLGLAIGLWQLGHPMARSLVGAIERQVQRQGNGQMGPPTATAASPASAEKAIPTIAAAVTTSSPAPSANVPVPRNTEPGVQTGSSPQPEGWIQSWPALLVLLWVLWFFFDTISRRASLVSKDSPRFRAALDIWSPLVMSIVNTPRSAKRFLNQVRYLAMRQRAFTEKDTPSFLDRFCSRLGEWFVSGPVVDETHARGMAPTPAGSSVGPVPRSLGAAAAAPGAGGSPLNIPESLLVALAAIHLVPAGLQGLLTNNFEGHVEKEYIDLIKEAIARHESELKDWSEIRDHIGAYRLLCSEVVAN